MRDRDPKQHEEAQAIRKRLIKERTYELIGLRESDFRAVLACASDADIVTAYSLERIRTK